MFLKQPDLYNVFLESLPLYRNIHFPMNKDEGSLDVVIWPSCVVIGAKDKEVLVVHCWSRARG
jgi:hypothetical protein